MASVQLPTAMKRWEYTTITNGIENSLHVNDSAPLPTPKPSQHLVKIAYTSLNPVDYKPGEVGLIRRLAIPNPCTPGIDYAGTIVQPAQGSDLKPGDRVFGCGANALAGGCLAEYALSGIDTCVKIPAGVSMQDASTIGVAGLTAVQSILAHNPKKVFLNGGSGGVGCFGIQLAKANGVHVTTSCSTRNVELCQSLGADRVVDYTKGSVSDQLKGEDFDHIVDNVSSGLELHTRAGEYTKPGAKYISVAGSPTFKYMAQSLSMKFRPSFLGGGTRHAEGMLAKPNAKELKEVVDLMAAGKVRAVIDEKFAFEDASKAFAKLKTGRARGKIVVEVAGET